jgi:hypothetical protein
MKKVGLVALALTLGLALPVLFILTRSSTSPNQFITIAIGVLLLVLWTIVYVTLVDPVLRRVAGSVFQRTIEWRGTSQSLSWTAVEETGCLVSLLVALLGYFFIALWLLPFGAGVALIWWISR